MATESRQIQRQPTSVIEETAGYGDDPQGRTTSRSGRLHREHLTLYVNDLKLVEVSDNEFPDGDVGLTAQLSNGNTIFGLTISWQENLITRRYWRVALLYTTLKR
jgi:hypothetical protein